jgi:hypothetical protein
LASRAEGEAVMKEDVRILELISRMSVLKHEVTSIEGAVVKLEQEQRRSPIDKSLEAFQTLYVKTLGYDDKIADQQRQIQKLDAEVAELKKLVADRFPQDVAGELRENGGDVEVCIKSGSPGDWDKTPSLSLG